MITKHKAVCQAISKEFEFLIPCRRYLDAEIFLDSVYAIACPTPVKEDSMWEGIPSHHATNGVDAVLLGILGEKPSYPITEAAMMAFHKRINEALASSD